MLTFEQLLLAKGKKPAKPAPFRITQSTIERAHATYKFPDAGNLGEQPWSRSNKETEFYATEQDADGAPSLVLTWAAKKLTGPELTAAYTAKFCKANHLKH